MYGSAEACKLLKSVWTAAGWGLQFQNDGGKFRDVIGVMLLSESKIEQYDITGFTVETYCE